MKKKHPSKRNAIPNNVIKLLNFSNLLFSVWLSFVVLILLWTTGCKKNNDTPITNSTPSRIIKDTLILSTSINSNVILAVESDTVVHLIIKDNIISAQNTNSHIIGLGSDPYVHDHMLDGALISGNKIKWTGTSLTDDDGAIIMRNFINVSAIYNNIINCPYGITTKCDGLVYSSGGFAYNIFGPSFKVGAGSKGAVGLKFYNNTFYNNRNVGEGVIGSIYISSNFDEPTNSAAKNCEIYNNVFYTKYQVANIYCDTASLSGLKCDNNLYWCESGEPVFRIAGNTITFSQWQARGFDTHSIVINPKFVDFDSLIPSSPLKYGKDLGTTWKQGLRTTTIWGHVDPSLKTQSTPWQVGAYVLE